MGGWQDHVDLVIEWGARGAESVDDAVWDVDVWDGTSRFWAGTEPDFTTLDGCELGNVTITRGRGYVYESFAVGTAQIQLILTDDVAGEPVPSDRWSWRSAMTIGDEIRITARLKEYPLSRVIYRGDIRSLDDKWSPFGVHLMDIACTEIAGRLGRIDMLEQESQGANELSGERMHRIADHARIPRSRRRFDSGIFRLQATNLARNLAGEAEVTTASEGGDLFTSSGGYLTFRQRAWWQVDPVASMVQFTWTNTDDYPPAPVPDLGYRGCPVTPNTRLSLDMVANEMSLARAGGTVQVARDTASMSRWGVQTFARSDLMNNNDEDVQNLASWRVAETGQRLRLIDGIEVNPLGDPETFVGIVAAGELGYLHRVVWDDGDEVTDVLFHLQGITHKISTERWTASLRVWDRYNYTPADGWDVDNWDEAVWAAPALLEGVA